jgi:hypothetical protein
MSPRWNGRGSALAPMASLGEVAPVLSTAKIYNDPGSSGQGCCETCGCCKNGSNDPALLWQRKQMRYLVDDAADFVKTLFSYYKTIS